MKKKVLFFLLAHIFFIGFFFNNSSLVNASTYVCGRDIHNGYKTYCSNGFNARKITDPGWDCNATESCFEDTLYTPCDAVQTSSCNTGSNSGLFDINKCLGTIPNQSGSNTDTPFNQGTCQTVSSGCFIPDNTIKDQTGPWGACVLPLANQTFDCNNRPPQFKLSDFAICFDSTKQTLPVLFSNCQGTYKTNLCFFKDDAALQAAEQNGNPPSNQHCPICPNNTTLSVDGYQHALCHIKNKPFDISNDNYVPPTSFSACLAGSHCDLFSSDAGGCVPDTQDCTVQGNVNTPGVNQYCEKKDQSFLCTSSSQVLCCKDSASCTAANGTINNCYSVTAITGGSSNPCSGKYSQLCQQGPNLTGNAGVACCDSAQACSASGGQVINNPGNGEPYAICNQINKSDPAFAACTGCDGVWTAVGCIPSNPKSIVQTVLQIGLSLAGGVALLMIIASGFIITISSGDQNQMKTAREMLTGAVVGLIFIIMSVTILQFIGVTILHIPGFGG